MNAIKSLKFIPATILILIMALVGFGALTAHAQNLSIDPPTVDCDSNAVIYCGVSSISGLSQKYQNGDGRNSAASIHHIFSHFGISSSDIDSLSSSSTTVVAGKVTNKGNVYDDRGKIIATDAISAGRQNMPGSTKVTSNGTTFYTRPTSVSFRSQSLGAFVVMKDGKFDYAILASCGNIVKATPKVVNKPVVVPTPAPTPAPTPVAAPSFSINKLAAPKGSSNFSKSVTVQSGDHVIIQIQVTNTSNTPITNLQVKDQLPPNMSYVDQSLMQDGTLSTQATPFFNDFATIPTLNPSASVAFTFESLAGFNDTSANCQAETLTDVATAQVSNLPAQQSTATVMKTCAPPPAVTSAAPTPQPTPPPKVLTNVGSSDSIAAFAAIGATGAGTFFYRWYIAKKLSRNL